jgi:hypothetical protein
MYTRRYLLLNSDIDNPAICYETEFKAADLMGYEERDILGHNAV